MDKNFREGAEDDSKSCGDDETRAMKCGDYDEAGGGREGSSNSDYDDGRTCTYIGDTNYVALTLGLEGT